MLLVQAGLLLEDALHLHSDTLWYVYLYVVHHGFERRRRFLSAADQSVQVAGINLHLRPIGDQVVALCHRVIPLGPARLPWKLGHAIALRHAHRIAELPGCSTSRMVVQADTVARLLHLVHVLVGTLIHQVASAVVGVTCGTLEILRGEDVLLASWLRRDALLRLSEHEAMVVALIVQVVQAVVEGWHVEGVCQAAEARGRVVRYA